VGAKLDTTKRPPSVLIIEGDEHLRQLTSAMLERDGFLVFQANDASEAADVWQQEQSKIDLLIADITTAGLGGPEMARTFRQVRPDLKILFTSGTERGFNIETGALLQGARFVRRPFGPNAILDWVRSQLPSGS
jgi:DNA-binding response OmpR family regulator